MFEQLTPEATLINKNKRRKNDNEFIRYISNLFSDKDVLDLLYVNKDGTNDDVVYLVSYGEIMELYVKEDKLLDTVKHYSDSSNFNYYYDNVAIRGENELHGYDEFENSIEINMNVSTEKELAYNTYTLENLNKKYYDTIIADKNIPKPKKNDLYTVFDVDYDKYNDECFNIYSISKDGFITVDYGEFYYFDEKLFQTEEYSFDDNIGHCMGMLLSEKSSEKLLSQIDLLLSKTV